MGNTASALHSASVSGDERRVLRDLQHGAHPNDQRIAPLHAAALFGRLNIMKLLLETSDVDIDRAIVLRPHLFPGFSDSKNPFPDSAITPLGCAILHGAVDGVKMIVEKGASLESLHGGPAPLSLAICSHAAKEVIECLLDAGVYTGGGADYVALAALHGNVVAMNVLYARGVTTDTTRTLNAVLTKTNRASIKDVCGTVTWLIDHGAKVQCVPRIMEKLVDIQHVDAFEVVVIAYRDLLTTARRAE